MTHRTYPRRLLLAASAALAALTLGGCYVIPVGPPQTPEVMTTVPPPAPYPEMYGAPPVVGQIWIGGYWNWGGARFAWTPGYWSAPRPGHYWRPHEWTPYQRGWRLNPGYWQRR